MGLLKRIKRNFEEADKNEQEMREIMQASLREEELFDRELGKVKFFPGSKAEYEEFVGYEVKIIDTGNADGGVWFGRNEFQSEPWRCYGNLEFKKKLAEQKIEALVNINFHEPRSSFGARYGLPVAKKI